MLIEPWVLHGYVGARMLAMVHSAAEYPSGLNVLWRQIVRGDAVDPGQSEALYEPELTLPKLELRNCGLRHPHCARRLRLAQAGRVASGG